MNVVHVIVHTPEQVREIVREAHKIALAAVAESDADGEVYDAAHAHALVFEQACTLLGQRSTFVQADAPMPTIPPPYAGRR